MRLGHWILTARKKEEKEIHLEEKEIHLEVKYQQCPIPSNYFRNNHRHPNAR